MRNWKYGALLVIAGIWLFTSFFHYRSRSTPPEALKRTIRKQKPAPFNTCPTIDNEHMVVHTAGCGKSDGGISGIIVTSAGKTTYTWLDASNNVVGINIDLKNVPAGQYKLEVKDTSNCAGVFSFPINVSETNGITIDAGNIKITPSGCNNDGSITGLKITSADTYIWRSFSTGAVVGHAADLLNVPPDAYILYTINSYDCAKQTDIYNVPSKTPLPRIASSEVTQPDCSHKTFEDSIVIHLTYSNGLPSLNGYLVDSAKRNFQDIIIQKDIAFTKLTFSGLAPGKYEFDVFGSDGCVYQLAKYEIFQPELVVAVDSTAVKDDECNQHIGFIVVQYSTGQGGGGVKYTWRDSALNIISNSPALRNIGAGTYYLGVQSGICYRTATFVVKNLSPALIPPKADNMSMCLPGSALIQVKNPDSAGFYKLYSNLSDTIPIDQSKTGIFYRRVNETTDFYIALKKVDCESTRTKVRITVVAPLTIPNTFTPNNDGINDTWNIAGMEKFPDAVIDVFNRQGQPVFHSLNYTHPFDGRLNGANLPNGVYYYVIDVKQPICVGKISGSLTIIR